MWQLVSFVRRACGWLDVVGITEEVNWRSGGERVEREEEGCEGGGTVYDCDGSRGKEPLDGQGLRRAGSSTCNLAVELS